MCLGKLGLLILHEQAGADTLERNHSFADTVYLAYYENYVAGCEHAHPRSSERLQTNAVDRTCTAQAADAMGQDGRKIDLVDMNVTYLDVDVLVLTWSDAAVMSYQGLHL